MLLRVLTRGAPQSTHCGTGINFDVVVTTTTYKLHTILTAASCLRLTFLMDLFAETSKLR